MEIDPLLSKADIIEGLLFASDKPLPAKRIAQILGIEAEEAATELGALREAHANAGGLQVVEVAGGWQFLTKPELSPYIKQLREAPRQRLSRAAFEVLAIVAYRQQVTRAEIEGLRAVDCAGPLQFLLDKKLVTFAGRKEAPGRPWLYATTPQFLVHFGLRSIEDLPSLEELAELNEGQGGHGVTQELFKSGRMAPAEHHEAVASEEVDENDALEPPEASAIDDTPDEPAP